MTSQVQQSPELGELVLGYFHSFTVGDPDWVERHVLDCAELRLIGTNPEEWLQGRDAFSMFRREAAEATGTLSADVTEIEAYTLDEVGWGAARVRFTTADDLVAIARFSVVFARRDGIWKVVNSHTSIPVPDEDAFSKG